MKFELGADASNLVVGARYEETDVTSANNHADPTCGQLAGRQRLPRRASRRWQHAVTGRRPSYNNMLPNLDFDIELTDSLKARFSYSKTIARASYGQLRAGVTSERLAVRRSMVRAGGNAEQSGAAAARVGQLRPLAGVVLRGCGLRVGRWFRRTSRTSSATRSTQHDACTVSATRPADRVRSGAGRRWRHGGFGTDDSSAVHHDGDDGRIPGALHGRQRRRSGPVARRTSTAGRAAPGLRDAVRPAPDCGRSALRRSP